MANYQSRYTGPEIDERLRKAGEAVLTEAQSLDTEKQAQARENIGAASSAALEGKVDKVSGKGLSTNDYTDEDKQTVSLVPTAVDTLGQLIGEKYTKPSDGIPKADLASGVQASLGKADTAYQKPQAGIPADDLAPGVIPDVSQFITDDDLSAALEAKQDTISDLADIRSGSQDNVKYTQQTLTNAQKEQARSNIGAGTYDKPDGGIPKSDLASGVQSSLAKADTALQEHQDISGKADKVSGATSGDFAGLDSNGNLTDSGKKLSDIAPRIYMGTCSTAAATVAKEATVEAFPLDANNKPLVGTVVGIKFTNTNSATAPTLNVNSTGAASIWYNNAAYEGKGAYGGSASRYIYYVWDGTYWAFQGWSYDADADTNTIGYNLRTNGGTAVAAAKLYRYRLLFTAPDGQSLVPSNTSSSTSTTAAKTVNQAKIDPFAPIWYYSTTSAVAAGASVSASYLWLQYSAIPLGYAFNRTGAALTMTARYPVYLKCAPQSDGSAIMDADTPIVQALPSTEDGKIYIFLGYAESEVNITLYYWHPVYYFKDGAIRQWTNAAAGGGGGGGEFVLTMVPPTTSYGSGHVGNIDPAITTEAIRAAIADGKQIVLYGQFGNDDDYMRYYLQGTIAPDDGGEAGDITELAFRTQRPYGGVFNGGSSEVTVMIGEPTYYGTDRPVFYFEGATPAISQNIAQDKTVTNKTTSPKAVADYVDGIVGDIETLLAAI